MSFDAAAYLRLSANHSLGATPSGIAFATSTGDVLEVSCYGPGVFRLRAGPDTRPDYGLVLGHAKPCTVTEAKPGTWTLGAGDTTLEITGAPLFFRLLHKGIPVLTSITDVHVGGATRLPTLGRLRRGEQWTASWALGSGEPVYGLGEKFGPLDKRGQLVYSLVENPFGVNTGLASKNTPFAWSPGSGARRGAWGVFANTPEMVTHGIGYTEWSHRSYAMVVDDEALDLFLFAADAPAGILAAYTALTGRVPPLPTWSLGLWVSRAEYDTPEDALAVAAKLRERRIPCDVMMLDGNSAWDPATRFNFEWDPQRFPDARATLAAIHAHNLRVGVAEHPYVAVDVPMFDELAARRYLLADATGDPYLFGWGAAPDEDEADAARQPPSEGGLVDFTNPEAYAWWRDAHRDLFADGVDVIKTDFGEAIPDDAVAFNRDRGRRLSNVYPLLYNQCVFEATTQFRTDTATPPVVISRAGWAASQRFPIAWSGDAQSDWEGLAASIRGALSLGMSGVPCHIGDVGGFHGPVEPPAELVLRWLQAAVFGSHLRLAGQRAREPWVFGAESETIARKWLAFRYRLIPYLAKTLGEAMHDGLPLMRAMPLAFPGNALVRHFETQFMCGDALLVAPIVGPGGEVDVALPPGAWYDLNSRQRFAGGRVLRYTAKLDQFPVFGREGHVLPLGRAVQHTGEIDALHPLEQLWVFGRPTRPFLGFVQATVTPDAAGTLTVHAVPGVDVQLFGDTAGLPIDTNA